MIDQNIPSQPSSPVKHDQLNQKRHLPPARSKTPIPSAPTAPKSIGDDYLNPIAPLSFGKYLNDNAKEPNLPQARLGLRKVERRISDFFQEALNMANGEPGDEYSI